MQLDDVSLEPMASAEAKEPPSLKEDGAEGEELSIWKSPMTTRAPFILGAPQLRKIAAQMPSGLCAHSRHAAAASRQPGA